MIIYFLAFIFTIGIGITLFMNLAPSFGGNLTSEQKEAYKKFDNFIDGKFVNKIPTRLGIGSSDSGAAVGASDSKAKEVNPKGEIPVDKIDWKKINSAEDSFTWLGHSTFLLSIDNKKLLMDPMLGPNASPVSFVGVKRYKYSEDLSNIIEELPQLDGVFISHDHYDHLDYGTILKLKDKVSHYFVPMGVSAHLIKWGVPKEKIIELNWWEEAKYEGLNIALTPSRHFSGRGIFNRNTTLWGGFVIKGENTKLYTSGDGGYGPHFKEIGEKYGPFDITLMEGGQYNYRWADVHMTPEQSVQGNIDAKGKNMVLMHWASFTLSNHGWREPIERGLAATEKSGVNLVTPKIGNTVYIHSELNNNFPLWWE